MNRKLILDTETTGLDFHSDKIIEIGIIELIDGIRTNNNFHKYINPQKSINYEAQKIHGLTNEFLKEKQLFSDICNNFLNFISDDTLVIHNSNFDISFINKELKNCGKMKLKNPVIDTISLAKMEFPGQSVNLDSLCRKLNITNTREGFHGALLDADLLCKVYLKLTAGKQEKLKLDSFKMNAKRDIKFKKGQELTNRSDLKVISEEEIRKHKKMIEEMEDPVWYKI